MKKLISFLAAAALLFILAFSEIAGIDIGQFSPSSDTTSQTVSQVQGSSYKTDAAVIDEDGSYFDKENVALYIHTYGKLPDNFITKDEARDLGWEGGSVEKYAPGKAIGGDRFGNYEGLLPKKKAAPTPNVTLTPMVITAAVQGE